MAMSSTRVQDGSYLFHDGRPSSGEGLGDIASKG